MSDHEVFRLRSGRVLLDSTVAVDNVDFELGTGEFLALLGANGSGKTTLVRALLGLVPLAAGQAFLFGQPIGDFRAWRRIGYVPQRSTGPSGGTASVMEVVLSGRIAHRGRFRRYRTADRRAATDALEVVGLMDLAPQPVTHLSGGQQQRVLIARALAGDPDVLVLDEPLAGVDVEHQERLIATLRDLKAQGRAVLLVAHGLGPIEDLVSREVVMDAARVVYDGPHHPDHVHVDQVHHPGAPPVHSPLDRAAGGS